MAKQSAGLLLFSDDHRLLLVHPSGGYNKRAPYSLPKGEPNPGEALEDAARRETLEEVGVEVTGPLIALGHVDYQKSRKRVFAWAAPLPAGAVARCASWEVDRAEWVEPERAQQLLHVDQRPFVDRLLKVLKP